MQTRPLLLVRMAVALLACMPSFAQSLQPVTTTENAVICKQSASQAGQRKITDWAGGPLLGWRSKAMRKRAVFLVIAIGLVGAVALGWTAIRRGFSARDNPSALETYIATAARNLSVRSRILKSATASSSMR